MQRKQNANFVSLKFLLHRWAISGCARGSAHFLSRIVAKPYVVHRLQRNPKTSGNPECNEHKQMSRPTAIETKSRIPCKRKCANCLAKEAQRQQTANRDAKFRSHINLNEMRGIEFPNQHQKLVWSGSFSGTRDF